MARTVRSPALVAETAGSATPIGDIALRVKSASKEGLRVKVVEEASGRPIADARVTASTLNYALIVSLGAERTGIQDVITRIGRTDDLGVCQLEGMPIEKYDVVVEAKGYVLEPVENVVVAAGRIENVAVSLQPGMSISGTVVDADSLPVVGAFVTALGFPSFRSYDRRDDHRERRRSRSTVSRRATSCSSARATRRGPGRRTRSRPASARRGSS